METIKGRVVALLLLVATASGCFEPRATDPPTPIIDLAPYQACEPSSDEPAPHCASSSVERRPVPTPMGMICLEKAVGGVVVRLLYRPPDELGLEYEWTEGDVLVGAVVGRRHESGFEFLNWTDGPRKGYVPFERPTLEQSLITALFYHRTFESNSSALSNGSLSEIWVVRNQARTETTFTGTYRIVSGAATYYFPMSLARERTLDVYGFEKDGLSVRFAALGTGISIDWTGTPIPTSPSNPC